MSRVEDAIAKEFTDLRRRVDRFIGTTPRVVVSRTVLALTLFGLTLWDLTRPDVGLVQLAQAVLGYLILPSRADLVRVFGERVLKGYAPQAVPFGIAAGLSSMAFRWSRHPYEDQTNYWFLKAVFETGAFLAWVIFLFDLRKVVRALRTTP